MNADVKKNVPWHPHECSNQSASERPAQNLWAGQSSPDSRILSPHFLCRPHTIRYKRGWQVRLSRSLSRLTEAVGSEKRLGSWLASVAVSLRLTLLDLGELYQQRILLAWPPHRPQGQYPACPSQISKSLSSSLGFRIASIRPCGLLPVYEAHHSSSRSSVHFSIISICSSTALQPCSSFPRGLYLPVDIWFHRQSRSLRLVPMCSLTDIQPG